MGRRRVEALRVVTAVVLGIALIGLSGCSPASPYGVRLNADGTVDFVACGRGGANVTVDYVQSWAAPADPEWVTAGDGYYLAGEVVRYGEAPYKLTTTILVDPPTEWIGVDLPIGNVPREDLVVGEWVWHGTSNAPWVPEHPCDGTDAEDLAR